MVVDRLAELAAVLRCAFRDAVLVWMVMAMMKLLGVRKVCYPVPGLSCPWQQASPEAR
jgi:hypothetical protein